MGLGREFGFYVLLLNPFRQFTCSAETRAFQSVVYFVGVVALAMPV
jgi:hypothetical protein